MLRFRTCFSALPPLRAIPSALARAAVAAVAVAGTAAAVPPRRPRHLAEVMSLPQPERPSPSLQSSSSPCAVSRRHGTAATPAAGAARRGSREGTPALCKVGFARVLPLPGRRLGPAVSSSRDAAIQYAHACMWRAFPCVAPERVLRRRVRQIQWRYGPLYPT